MFVGDILIMLMLQKMDVVQSEEVKNVLELAHYAYTYIHTYRTIKFENNFLSSILLPPTKRFMALAHHHTPFPLENYFFKIKEYQRDYNVLRRRHRWIS